MAATSCIGFERIGGIYPELRQFTLCTGQTCSAGDVIGMSATTGYCTKGTANMDDIVGVAAHNVASAASVGPAVLVWDPRNIFRVARKSGETAGIPLDEGELCHLENARSIDLSSTNGASSQFRVLRVVDTAASGACEGTFRLAKTIYG